MVEVLTFLCFYLGFVVVASVVIPVGLVLLIDKVWGYEPDAYERAYGENPADEGGQ